MKDEVMKVLKMVEMGKINSDKAAQLIDAIDDSAEIEYVNKYPKIADKELRIKVYVKQRETINIVIPIKVLGMFMQFIQGILDNGNEYTSEKIIEKIIGSKVEGKIVEFKTEQGDRVELSIE